MDTNLSLILLLFALTITLLVIIVINTVRISKLNKKINRNIPYTHNLHTMYDYVETEDMNPDLKHHLKTIVSGKLYPMLVEYLDRFMEVNGVIDYLNRNEKKLNKIVDILVEQSQSGIDDMEPNMYVVNFLKEIDLDAVVKYMEEMEMEEL